MIEHTSQVLGFHSLLDLLSRYASCSLGQSNCLSLKPSNDKNFIENELRLVSEMRLLLKVRGFVSLSDLCDISKILRKSRAKGSCLQPKELLRVGGLVEACRDLKKHIGSERELIPGLYGIVKELPGFHELLQTLKKTLSSYGEVKDSASSALKKIREKKIRLR